MIHRLDLGAVELPATHPRAADGRCPIFGYAIIHADGVLVVDTGTAAGHPVIDELYRPTVTPLVEALHGVGIDERDVTAIANTHLHFDHCGQNDALPNTPVWVTEAELTAAEQPYYTVPEWAAVAPARLRVAADGVAPAPGVRLLHTPGHTPGHQSVVVDTAQGSIVLAGQACYTCAEYAAGHVAPGDLHDDAWAEAARDSLARLRAFDPIQVVFSHDPATYHRPG